MKEYKELIYRSNLIKDEFSKKYYLDTLKYLLEDGNNRKRITNYVDKLGEFLDYLIKVGFQPNKCSWDEICDIAHEIGDSKLLSIHMVYFGNVIKNETYSGKHKNKLLEFMDIFEIQSNIRDRMKLFSYDDIVYLYRTKNYKNNGEYKSNISLQIKVINKYLRETLFEFVQSKLNYYPKIYGVFFQEFERSLGQIEINCIDDFNIDSFDSQFWYFKDKNQKIELKQLVAFYIFLMQKVEGQNILTYRDGITLQTLKRAYFYREYSEGIKAIPYNPYDPVPEVDRWILIPNGYEYKGNIVKASSTILIDLTVINSLIYRKWIKQWFWNNSNSLVTKLDGIAYISRLMNYITSLKTGDVFNVFVKPSEIKDEKHISCEEAFAYKTYIIGEYSMNRTQESYIYGPRNFLKYIKINNLANVEDGIFYYLTNKRDNSSNNSRALSDEELTKLEYEIKEKAEESLLVKLYQAIFYIAIQTEFRISTILNLKLGCAEETDIKGQYHINASSKVSSDERSPHAITPYLNRLIEEIEDITKPVRSLCHDELYNKELFLLKSANRNGDTIIDIDQFNDFLHYCCEKAGIEDISSQNLRDTHMTMAKEYIIKNSLSNMELGILTGHKMADTTNRSYIKDNIQDLLQATHKIIIGEIEIEGKVGLVTPKHIINDTIVCESCGYCKNKSCDIVPGLSCLICKSFIATLDRIDFFYNQLKKVDKLITDATLPHDKEDLCSIKKVVAAYIRELLVLKNEVLSADIIIT